MRLIVSVEHGGFGIAPHAGRAHLVDGEAWRTNSLKDLDVPGAGSREHFPGLDGDVLGHGQFILAPSTVNLEGGNAPGVGFFLVDIHVIVVIRQALAKTTHSQAPLAGLFERVFEIRAKSYLVQAAPPAFAVAAALVAIAADEILLLFFHVAETRNVKAVRAIAKRHLVFMPGHDAAGAAAHVVIYEILAEFAAGVGQTIGEFRRRGIEKDARGFKGRGAKEKDAGLKFKRRLGLRVDDTHAADAARFRVEVKVLDHAVRADGEATGFLRGRERGI